MYSKRQQTMFQVISPAFGHDCFGFYCPILHNWLRLKLNARTFLRHLLQLIWNNISIVRPIYSLFFQFISICEQLSFSFRRPHDCWTADRLWTDGAPCGNSILLANIYIYIYVVAQASMNDVQNIIFINSWKKGGHKFSMKY